MSHPDVRAVSRTVLAVLYAAAGVLHLAAPEPFLDITPAWVPWPEQVIRLTGVAELLGAAGLVIGRTRKAAGIGLALYALCVWPANVEHARQALDGYDRLPPSWWYHGPRLALQPVIIWWALWASGAVDWPFARRHG